jgi:hypothetical protein
VAANLTLRQLSNTGDTTKGLPLTNAEIDQNFINLKTAATVTLLDDITNSFDGTTKSFSLTSNAVPITVDSEHALLITLGRVLMQPNSYSVNVYEQYVFPQELDEVLDGNFTVSGSTITFTAAPSRSQKFYGRLLGTYVSALNTTTRNIFRAIPIVLS